MVHEIIQFSKPRAVHLPFPDKYNPGISWSRFDSFQNSEFWNFKTKPKSFRFWIPRFLWGGGVRGCSLTLDRDCMNFQYLFKILECYILL